jgi:hypothetical protein|tara:strand:+ start:2976 stop:3563 length:588 start_codon:yes stop_codon:yes gene_type:complete
MKNIYKIFLVGLIAAGSTISCTDSELAIDSLYEGVDKSGAFIRTIESPFQLVNLTDPTKNFIAATIEVQEGQGDVSTFTEVRVFISSYNDQDQLEATLDTSGNPLTEVLLSTLPASDFTPSAGNRLPSNAFSIPTQTLVDLYPDAVFTIPTFVVIRLELELADGRVFTDVNVGPTVSTGNYFTAPSFYNIIFLPI